ncbi:pectinesterase-like [Rutidosis leptorrhynchoides]|uniref:pectinesterase-like n=1 Tax=Rutidosis leptorrhynchoides TaxID=125765 RepID=UPI003A99E651
MSMSINLYDYGSAFTFLHVLVIMFISFGIVHGDNPTTTFSVCSRAPYPKICTYLIGKTSIETPFDIRRTTLESTLAQAEKAYEHVSSMDLSSFEPRAKSAWADCLELYEDSLYQLNRSLGSTDSNDIQTWLSSVSTNHVTCQNGFHDFNLSSHYQTFHDSSLSGFSKYVSNSLAINKAITPILTINPKQIKGRKLMMSTNNKFPTWLSKNDRKLLATPSSATSADIVVAQDGSGNYKTISEAISAVSKLRKGSSRFTIHVKAGVYKENVEISKTINNLMIFGDGIGSTVVTSSKNVQDGTTTFRSATFAVSGSGVIIKDMSFENTAGPAKHQAVAFRSGSDLSVVYNCAFKGYQDTLYVYSGRQFYRNCLIYGTEDFIFGNAAVVVQSCNIYVRKPLSGQKNTITAQSRTDPNQNTGIVVHNSAIQADSDLKGSIGSVQSFLGRPWMQYSRTVFMKCSIDGLIDPAGWLQWSGSFALSTLYYGEYSNTGAGAGTGGRVKWPGYHVITSASEASKFTVGAFLDGDSWISGTGLPYTSGL